MSGLTALGEEVASIVAVETELLGKTVGVERSALLVAGEGETSGLSGVGGFCSSSRGIGGGS